MSGAAAIFSGKESVVLEPIPGQAHWQAVRGLKATVTAMAQEHPDMGARECLATTVWLPPTPGKDVRGYSPLQHALGTDLNGRFYTPEYEALPTVQAELVDDTHGNNIKRMQDSEVNFFHWTHQKRVSRALNSKNRKAQIFLPWTYVYFGRKGQETKGSSRGIACVLCTETRRDNEKGGSTGPLLLMPGAPRPAPCVWLCRAGRLMRADPTQLRLASGRQEAYQEPHVSHQMPWTARGELQKLQKGHYLDFSTDIHEGEQDPWTKTHLGTCRQTSPTHQHQTCRTHDNGSSQKRTVESAKAATACWQVAARRHHKNVTWTGAQVTRHWRYNLR